ncbi:MAG TPA: hypothetical protein PKA64_07210 [Myxococcota bacterium]|nr:hypothetical protein [Myxococcota bacterium]
MLPLLLACKGDAPPDPGAFDPPFAQTWQSLDVLDTTGATSPVGLYVDGAVTVGGATLPAVTLVHETDGSPVGLTLGAEIEGAQVTLGTVSISAALAGVDVTLTPSAPLVVDMGAPVGVTQHTSISGTVTVGDPPVSGDGYLPIDLTWTVASTDTSAPAPMGDVPGCREASFSASAAGLTASGRVWIRDDTGFVHATLDDGTWGPLTAGMAGYGGWADFGDVTVVQSEHRVDLANPTFSLTSNDAHLTFDADKNTHAQMWLEARWADDAMAHTTEPPPLSFTFGANLGWFPASWAQSSIGLLHPGDDDGYVWWVAAVDQAAKNDPAPNPIVYWVDATYTGTGPGVIVGAFIRYTRAEP